MKGRNKIFVDNSIRKNPVNYWKPTVAYHQDLPGVPQLMRKGKLLNLAALIKTDTNFVYH